LIAGMRPHSMLNVTDAVHIKRVETDFPGHDCLSDAAGGG
jgi:hypothetical protein